MTDLSTTHMGMNLKNPIIIGASGLTKTVDGVLKCAKAGAGAVVLKSIFEEEIQREYETTQRAYTDLAHMEAFSHVRPDVMEQFGARHYLNLVTEASQNVDIPVMASVNCTGARSWLPFVRELEKAGADGIELNIFALPTDPTLQSDSVEDGYLQLIAQVKKEVSIPVSVKLVPYLTNLKRFAHQADLEGASALILFNRFFHPDFDVERMELTTKLSLSNADEYRLPLRWVSLLNGAVGCDLVGTSGVHDADTVVKMLLGGAAAVQVVSAIYHGDFSKIELMLSGLTQWMERHEFDNIPSFRGRLSHEHVKEPHLLERTQYVKAFAGAE